MHAQLNGLTAIEINKGPSDIEVSLSALPRPVGGIQPVNNHCDHDKGIHFNRTYKTDYLAARIKYLVLGIQEGLQLFFQGLQLLLLDTNS